MKWPQIKRKIMDIFKKEFVVGIEIDGGSLSVVRFLEDEDGNLRAIKADRREITPSSGDSADEESTAKALKELFKGLDTRRSSFVVNINCPNTSLKEVLVPLMPLTELREGIRLEAKNYFPFPVDKSIIDSEILREVSEEGIKRYEVLVAASPRKTVEQYLSVFEKAGIRPSSFIPSIYSLQMLAGRSKGLEGKTVCFLNLGELYADIVIFSFENGSQKPRLVFSRKMPLSGQDIIKSLTGTLVTDKGKVSLSMKEARVVLKEVGIPEDNTESLSNSKIPASKIMSMLIGPLERLSEEIGWCFDYYRETSKGEAVDLLILFGSQASMKGLTHYLSERMDMEVKVGNPLEGIESKKGALDKGGEVSSIALAV
ncbi:MAG: pilus assembly protein PilM, partial [Candidatus Omnitrophica bacterium]|nr:pilus assembly protein PilM [Candidatus Omnitrophota bacterium]